MEKITYYSLNEIIALVTAVLIGTGGYIGFMVRNKDFKADFKSIFWIIVINLFVTYICSELLKIFKWGAYRTLVLPVVAYSGQYLLDWFNKRYPKIFDAGLKKTTGIDVNNKENEDTE